MRIAILGATSQIAKDLIHAYLKHDEHDLFLFARRPSAVKQWLKDVRFYNQIEIAHFDDFNSQFEFEAILNFVGVGDPAQAAAMGASIFDITLKYDDMALGYLIDHPQCRYIFLSSGAAYGSSFEKPVDENTKSIISINNLWPQDWYAVAKLHAECRHRSLVDLPIIDIRVFNYFSHTQDMSARFFITDILQAIRTGETLYVSPDNVVRDYIGPDDFFNLVILLLQTPKVNDVVDCYTLAPIEKMNLLAAMHERFGLIYKVREGEVGVNATGLKMNYFSRNRRAGVITCIDGVGGWSPSKTSLETIIFEASQIEWCR